MGSRDQFPTYSLFRNRTLFFSLLGAVFPLWNWCIIALPHMIAWFVCGRVQTGEITFFSVLRPCP